MNLQFRLWWSTTGLTTRRLSVTSIVSIIQFNKYNIIGLQNIIWQYISTETIQNLWFITCLSSFESPTTFMVTPCINNAEPFYYQLMHIMLKNTELLKHTFTQCTIHTPYRVSPILYLSYPICFLLVWIFIHILHTYPSLQSQYAAIELTTPCTSFMQILFTNV